MELSNDINNSFCLIVNQRRVDRTKQFWSLIKELVKDNKRILVISTFQNFHFNRLKREIEGLEEILANINILWIPTMHFSVSEFLRFIEKQVIRRYDVIGFIDFSAQDFLFLSRDRFDLLRIKMILLAYFNNIVISLGKKVIITAPISPKSKIWFLIDKESLKKSNLNLKILEDKNVKSEFSEF